MPNTTNKALAVPSSGTLAGLWGSTINENMSILDNCFGGVATVALTNANVTLSSSQSQCAFVRLTGAISANVDVVFPSVGSFYTIINDTTNSSAFVVTAKTALGTLNIGLPPGSMTDILTSSGTVIFRGLPHVGAYWDHAGSSTPAWVTACTIPPWLYCNGTTFSSATYPILTTILGSTTLPDFRGRSAFNLNDGTGRITSSGGIDGNTIFNSGGIQTTSLTSQNLPNTSFSVTDAGHVHSIAFNNLNAGIQGLNGGSPFANYPTLTIATITVSSNTTGITAINSGGTNTPFALTPPSVIGGIRLVRAA